MRPRERAGLDHRGLRLAVAAGAVTAALQAGCLVGPRYEAPKDTAPAHFKELSQAVSDGGADDGWKVADPKDASLRGKWWEIFGEVELNGLEDQLNINNQTLKQYFENFMAARALIAQGQAQYWPTVSVGTSYSYSYSPLSATAAQPAAPGSLFALPIDVSWAPDLFGRIRNTVRQYQYSAEVSAADLENERLLEQAALAEYFFQLRGQDALKDILDETMEADQKSLDYTRAQFETGVGSEISVVEAQNTLETAQAVATGLDVARAQYEHAIAMLIGKPASDFSLPRRGVLTSPPPIPVSVPSELLERRPDVAAAERTMAAANAQLGVAYAAYYPNLTLSLTGGLESTNLGRLFELPSRFWSMGPSISETVFEGGMRSAVVNQGIATYNADLAAYRQAVLVAFQQVEDELAAVRVLWKEVAQQKLAMDSAQKNLRLEKNRYETGLDPYVDVVLAQNTLLASQQTLAQIQVQQMTAAVQLIQALGGGWDTSQLPSVETVSSPSPKEQELQH